MLLKKVWESVLSTSTSGRLSSGSRWSNNNSNNNIISSSTGDFDRIPDEILGLIFRKLGPKESAKICLVCKTWRNIIISDNKLWIHFFKTTQLNFWDWDSIVFSETLLISYPNPDSAVFYSQ